MKTYTLHVDADATPGDAGTLDRAVLVKDGFSWGAFVFSFFWFFAHRLWIAGLIVLIAAGALGASLQLLRVGAGAGVSAAFLFAVLLGLEANSLRRWTLARSGRPAVDVVRAGDREEAETKAFARWLGRGRPAFVPRPGAAPREVVARIHEAGGIASLAHPGLLGHDEWLPGFAADGLDALEAYHSKHDDTVTGHYLSVAAGLGLVVTGGSDYHADEAHGPAGPGSVSLPPDAYARLVRLKVETATADRPRSA